VAVQCGPFKKRTRNNTRKHKTEETVKRPRYGMSRTRWHQITSSTKDEGQINFMIFTSQTERRVRDFGRQHKL
jgi:hypothetical protein